MKIEKTESGYDLYLTHSIGDPCFVSPSDYQQLRDHFAREIVEGLTDEKLDSMMHGLIEKWDGSILGRDKNRERWMLKLQGASWLVDWLRSQITGGKK